MDETREDSLGDLTRACDELRNEFRQSCLDMLMAMMTEKIQLLSMIKDQRQEIKNVKADLKGARKTIKALRMEVSNFHAYHSHDLARLNIVCQEAERILGESKWEEIRHACLAREDWPEHLAGKWQPCNWISPKEKVFTIAKGESSYQASQEAREFAGNLEGPYRISDDLAAGTITVSYDAGRATNEN